MNGQKKTILEMVQSLERGGRTKRLCQTAEALQNHGYHIKILTLKQPPDWVVDQYFTGFDWQCMPRPSQFSLTFLLKLVAYVKRHQVNAIHAHCEASYLYGGLAGRLLGVPVVGTYHRSNLDFYQPELALRLMGKLLTVAVSISTDRQKLMEANLKIPSSKITLISGGVDFREFKDITESEIRKHRQQYGLTGKQVLLSVGHLGPIKGHDYTIKAMGQLKERFPNASLFIAGMGSQSDQHRLEQLIRELELEDRVTLLGQRSDVHLWMTCCDLFVMAPVEEGFGLVFVEAGACSKATVATQVGGIKDIIVPGTTGVLVPPKNVDALADAIAELLADPGKLHSYGEAARLRVAESFTVERMGNLYGQLFDNILASNEKRRFYRLNRRLL